MFGKFYVLWDSIPCCFSEAILGEFLATSTSILHIFSVDASNRFLGPWCRI